MKSLIVYQGKYGATRQYAKWLSEELHVSALPADTTSSGDLKDEGILIMGSSVYIGKLQLSSWIREHQKELAQWQLYLFVVCGTPSNEKEKLNKYLSDSVPASLLARCRIFFLPGRMIYKDLSRRDRFMLRMGAWLAGKKTGKKMLTDYDDVKKEHLQDMFSNIKQALAPETGSACSVR